MSDKPEEVPAAEEVKIDCSNPDVVTKYRAAGDIANAALKVVLAMCKAGTKIVDVCAAGDGSIMDATGKIYKGKKIEKGIGFPTCVSVNNVVGHFSPYPEDLTVLKAGDLAKIDLGVQVDGYVAVLAHTILIGEEGPSATPATGKAGDLLAAVYHASEIALRLLKPGSKNSAITDAIEKVAADFKVNAVHGVLSHQMEQNIVDGEKVIINKADVEEKVEEFEFAPYEVYAIDIVMTTGEGKPKERDDRCTVYKRQVDETYSLKMKASRSVLSNIKKNHAIFPFTMRALLATDKAAKFGVKECVEHKLLRAYPVLLEKEGELVAHCKFTALLLPNGTIRVAESGLATTHFESEHKLTDEELVKLLAKSAGNKKKKNNKKKKTAGDKAEVEE